MIQDIAPIHLHNEFQYKKPKAESRMLAYGSRMIFLDNTDEKAGIRFITYEQLNAFYKESGLPMPSCIYLFEMGGEDCMIRRNVCCGVRPVAIWCSQRSHLPSSSDLWTETGS